VNPNAQDQQADEQRTENVKKKPGDIDQQHATAVTEVESTIGSDSKRRLLLA
jgi:hypothetical protein